MSISIKEIVDTCQICKKPIDEHTIKEAWLCVGNYLDNGLS